MNDKKSLDIALYIVTVARKVEKFQLSKNQVALRIQNEAQETIPVNRQYLFPNSSLAQAISPIDRTVFNGCAQIAYQFSQLKRGVKKPSSNISAYLSGG